MTSHSQFSRRSLLRTMSITLSLLLFATVFASIANAGCGTFDPQQPFTYDVGSNASSVSPRTSFNESGGPAGSIVGMWKVKLISIGNQNHNPPIPDGVLLDFGYSQWHSDGTEFLNSGGRSPATQNYCLGVWKQTGKNAYTLNHFALSYDLTTGALQAKVNIREQIALDLSGDSQTGAFTIDVYAAERTSTTSVATLSASVS